MRNEQQGKVDSELALYIGYSCHFFALVSLGGLLYWIYKIQTDDVNFHWMIFVGLAVVTIVSFICGVVVLRKRTKK